MKDILLCQSQRRGLHLLEKYWEVDFSALANFVFSHRKRTILSTGFYILSAGTMETDGFPGAWALARALHRLGGEVHFVSEEKGLEIWRETSLEFPSQKVEFPPLDRRESQLRAREIADEIQPTLLVSIERCGPNEKGEYLNFQGKDITDYTAKIDCLFELFAETTLAIGDGGNEIGMGLLAPHIKRELDLSPCVTTSTYLILATVSNWGSYALIRALEKKTNRLDLLPTPEEEEAIITRLNSLGVVDGVSGKCQPTVDGISLEVHREILLRLARA